MFNYIAMGDNHIHNTRTDHVTMFHNLDMWFERYDDIIRGIDAFMFEGDFFDKALGVDRPVTVASAIWLSKFFKLCVKYRVIVRMLDGTDSHDKKQGHFVEYIASKTSVDFKFVHTLSIEYLAEWDINVLYVPDEWRVQHSQTLTEVKSLLVEHDLESVDIAIMHGLLGYQVPAGLDIPHHDESEYARIVDFAINIGHDHRYLPLDKFLPAGSFDRIAFGEEDPKGAIHVSITDVMSHQFLENVWAKMFIDVVLRDDHPDPSGYIEKKVMSLPKGSYVRIEGDPLNPFFREFKSLSKVYPDYVFERKNRKPDGEVKKVTLMSYDVVSLNTSNLSNEVSSYLKNKGYSEEDGSRLVSLLGEYL